MQFSTSKVLLTLGAGALLVGCPDDTTGESAGESESQGSTSGTDGMTSPTASGSASGSASTSTSSDSMSGSETTGDPPVDTTGEGETTGEGPDTEGTDGGSTSGGEDGTTTGGGTTEGLEGSTGGPPEICEAPGELVPCDEETDDPFNALGLNCGLADPNTHIPIYNEVWSSTDADAWKIATQFGTHIDPATLLPQWAPREGSSMLLISTGRHNDPIAGVVTEGSGVMQTGVNNSNPDGSVLPAPMSPDEGSNGGAGGTPFINCDGAGDCSDSLEDQWNAGEAEANDLIWFQFELDVPGGTHGFSFDFAYFSAEFPEYVGTQFNDIFAVWSDSETYTGNLCFVNDEPCTVTALGPSVEYLSNDSELDGTGFDTVGEATAWFNAKGSAEPGELLQLTFALFDMGDSAWDTTVILDNFQWDCEGCVPSEVEPCIGIDPV